jgi:hypothetical protein
MLEPSSRAYDRRRALGILGGALVATFAPRVAIAKVAARSAPAGPGSFGGLLQTAQQISSAIGDVRLRFALISQQFGSHTHTYTDWQTGINTIPVDHGPNLTMVTCSRTQTQTTAKTTAAVPGLPASTIPLLVNIATVDQLVAIFPSFDHDVDGLAQAMAGFQQAFVAHTHAYYYNSTGISQESVHGSLYRFAIPSASGGTSFTDPPNNVASLASGQPPAAAPYNGSAQQEYLDGVSARVSALANQLTQIDNAIVAHSHGYVFQNFAATPIKISNYSVQACLIATTPKMQTSVASVPKIEF